MAGSVDVRPASVEVRMDLEAGSVGWEMGGASNSVPVVVDKDQVRNRDERKVHSETSI